MSGKRKKPKVISERYHIISVLPVYAPADRQPIFHTDDLKEANDVVDDYCRQMVDKNLTGMVWIQQKPEGFVSGKAVVSGSISKLL